MMPWLQMRFIAFCASCSTRFSFSFSACIARISSVEPVSATRWFSRAFSSSFAAACFTYLSSASMSAFISCIACPAAPPAMACVLRSTSSASSLRLATSQSFLQWLTDAASAGRASRAPAAAIIRFCLVATSHMSCHAEKPFMMPWFMVRLIAL